MRVGLAELTFNVIDDQVKGSESLLAWDHVELPEAFPQLKEESEHHTFLRGHCLRVDVHSGGNCRNMWYEVLYEILDRLVLSVLQEHRQHPKVAEWLEILWQRVYSAQSKRKSSHHLTGTDFRNQLRHAFLETTCMTFSSLLNQVANDIFNVYHAWSSLL